MNINNAFPSKYLKSGDIPEDSDLVLTIREVVQETVGQGDEAESKPIVYFQEQDKGLVLNKTNATAIANLYGPETDGWAGKRIALFATEVDYAGKQTLALRVRLKAPSGAAEVWAIDRARAELEKNGLTVETLKAALIAKGYVTDKGSASYSPSRDTDLVKQIITDALAAPAEL